MHISMVNNYLYLRGGSERVMFEESEFLRSRQVTVSYFSRDQERNIRTEYDALFPTFIDPEQLSVTGKIRHIPRILYNRQTYDLFTRFLQRARPQLIHAHNIYGGLTSAICDAAKHQELPILMTLHDFKLICPAYLMLRKTTHCEACQRGAFYYCITNRCHKNNIASSLIYTLESYLTRWGGKYDVIRFLVCPSEFLRQQLIKAGFPSERTVYLPNGIDVERYEPCYAPGEYMLFVGRLSKEKGIFTLLAAMRDLPVPLAIAGDGPLREELEAYVQRHAMEDRVTFFGHQSGKALQRLYQGATCVAFPSECYENAPMTILEAFAAGKAVIGTRIGGIPELIKPGKTGLLVTPGNTDELRSSIMALWEKNQDCVEMGRTARGVAETQFTLQRHIDDLLSLYRRAMTE